MHRKLGRLTLSIMCTAILFGVPCAYAGPPPPTPTPGPGSLNPGVNINTGTSTLSDWDSHWDAQATSPNVWDVCEWTPKMSGNQPDWWLDPWALQSPLNMRIGWDSWAHVETRAGHEDPSGLFPRLFDPDLAYLDFEPSNVAPPWGKWMWDSNINKWNYGEFQGPDPSDGLKVIDATDEYNRQIDLEITNHNLRDSKLFYAEFWFNSASGIDEDLEYLKRDMTVSYEWGTDPHVVTPLRSGWDQKVENGTTYAVYYEELKIDPQPNIDKILWHFWPTFEPDNDYEGDIYMKRVSIGSTCTPEPSAFVLLALSGLPVAALLRRRKKT